MSKNLFTKSFFKMLCLAVILTVAAMLNVCAAELGNVEIVGADNRYTVSATYGTDAVEVVFTAENGFDGESAKLAFTFNGASELVAGEAWKVTASQSGNKTAYSYKKSAYSTKTDIKVKAVVSENTVTYTVPYSAFNKTSDAAMGAFAFYPTVVDGETYKYSDPFATEKYGETWFLLSADGKISYDDSYSDYQIENWSRPSFVNHDSMFVAVIKESSVEEAIIAMAIGEEKGAMGFDVHLNYLYNAGLLSVENLSKIFKSTTKPVLAINYNGNISQELRREQLVTAINAGAAAIDLPAFMFCDVTSTKTHTAENIEYWENLGFGMSFVSTTPEETPIDPVTIERQKAFIESIHEMGIEVLISCHVDVVFTKEQMVDYIRFNAAKGVDVVKLVAYGYTTEDVAACVEACKTLRDDETLGSKFSAHLSGGSTAYITRVLCPVFYGSYVAFCYPELTYKQDAKQLDMDMATEVIAAGVGADKDISIDGAIARLLSVSRHEQLIYLVSEYENGAVVGKAYGSTTDFSDNWSFDGNDYFLLLRDVENTTSYNMRAHAYNEKKANASSLYISTSISGSFTPYVSSSRVPKAGVYIGTEEKMVAWVYNLNKKTFDLVSNPEYAFSFDNGIKKDVLVSSGLITPVSIEADVTSGGEIKLGMRMSESTLDLYAGTTELVKIASLPLDEALLAMIGTNEDGLYNIGVLSEIYMGSSSVGMENSLTFANVSYEQLVGDANGDGALDIKDVLLAVKALCNNKYDVSLDTDEDGAISVFDILYILKAVMAVE